VLIEGLPLWLAQTNCWIVAPDGKSVQRRPVSVGERDAETIRVTEGLMAGERVVVAGVHSLNDGQAVRPPEALR